MARSYSDVERSLSQLRRRFAVRLFLRSLTFWLPLFVLAGAAAWLAARLDWIPPIHVSVPILAAVAVLMVGAGAAIVRLPSPIALALILDRRLETRELITAAFEAGPENEHPLGSEARRRASGVLSEPRARDAVAISSWRCWRPTLLALATLVPVAFVPDLSSQPQAARTAPQELIDTGEVLSKKVDELAADRPEIEDDAARKPLDELKQFAEDLQQGRLTSQSDALLALEKVEQAVEAYRDSEALSESNRLAQTLDDMQSDPFAGEMARAMAKGDVEALRDSLQRMAEALSGVSAEARANVDEIMRLAERFRELAERFREMGQDDIADTLDEIAAALQAYDVERAQELLESFSQSEQCDQMGTANIARELSEALNMARFLLNTGMPRKLEQPGEEGSGGTGGPFPGTASTNEAADPFASGDPIVRDRSSKETSDAAGSYEALYESHIIEAESWVDVQARGDLGGEGEFASETGRSLGIPGESKLPPGSFPAAAGGAEERAAELERIPLGYRDLVRRYFAREAPAPPSDGEPE